jgi:hypothetical protein
VPHRASPSRDDLLAVLGAQPGTTATAACDGYLERRRELLAADPDPRRPEVVRLDDAFSRLRSAADVERRLGDYQRARVRIGVDDGTVEVRAAASGTTDGEFPFPGVERVHVITAFNPRNRTLRPQDNANRQRALARRVAAAGLPAWPAVGGDERHAEPSIAVAGLTTAGARELGAEFEQDAIFEWTPTTWSVVPCDELVEAPRLGWRSTRLAAPLPDPLAGPARWSNAAGDASRDAAAAEAAAIARARARTRDERPGGGPGLPGPDRRGPGGPVSGPDSAEPVGDPPPKADASPPGPETAPGAGPEPTAGPRDLPASRGGGGE